MKNKPVIITGAASGIGKELQNYLQNTAKVVLSDIDTIAGKSTI